MCITSVDQYENIKYDMFYYTLHPQCFIISSFFLIYVIYFLNSHSTWTELKFELKNTFDIVDMNEINNRQFNSFDFEIIMRNHYTYIILVYSFY